MSAAPIASHRHRRQRRRRWTGALGLFVLLTAVAGLYSALAPRSQAETANSSIAVRQGRQLYLTGCASCHGLEAQGSAQGPSLIGAGSAAVSFQVGTGRMPLQANAPQGPQKKPKFTPTEVDQLAAYIASLAPGPATPTDKALDLSNADAATGQSLFATNCAQCHNFAGEGGALTKGKFAPSLAETSDRHIWEAMLTGPSNMPVFSDEQITPQQKRDIIAFLNQLRETGDPGGLPLGRLGPVSEGLIGWVVGIGLAVAATIWIGAKQS